MGNRGIERYEIGIKQTNESIDLYDYLLISYTNELDPIFIPEGKTKTMAHYNDQERFKLWNTDAYDKLAEYLKILDKN